MDDFEEGFFKAIRAYERMFGGNFFPHDMTINFHRMGGRIEPERVLKKPHHEVFATDEGFSVVMLLDVDSYDDMNLDVKIEKDYVMIELRTPSYAGDFRADVPVIEYTKNLTNGVLELNFVERK